MNAEESYKILQEAIAVKKKLVRKYSDIGQYRRVTELKAELKELELQEERFRVKEVPYANS